MKPIAPSIEGWGPIVSVEPGPKKGFVSSTKAIAKTFGFADVEGLGKGDRFDIISLYERFSTFSVSTPYLQFLNLIEAQPREIKIYVSKEEGCPFELWFKSLRDRNAKARIRVGLTGLKWVIWEILNL